MKMCTFSVMHCIVNSGGLSVRVTCGNCILSASVAAPFTISPTEAETSIIPNITPQILTEYIIPE
jgi:hypothetical protein